MRELRHYKDTNELIRQAINEFNWQKAAFLNTSVKEKVDIFDSTILNIPTKFIPHEVVLCDDKDPPWFNKKIRALIQKKKCCI